MNELSALSPIQIEQLRELAQGAKMHAYAPYSHFPVGAAILSENGAVHAGCNIEDASLQGGACAERSAIFTAVAHGDLSSTIRLRAVLVYTPTLTPTAPCGLCRQMIYEFARKQTIIFSTCKDSKIIQWTIAELLPYAFGPDDLSKD